jgi:hypothetical protein
MTTTPQDLQAKRAIEDRLIKLGNERDSLAHRVSDNIQAITDTLETAIAAGIPIERASQLIRVSRQTLYRWKEGAIRAS